jgi:hypothetical protein
VILYADRMTGSMERALTTGLDFSKPPQFPPVPDSYDAILQAVEDGHQRPAEDRGGAVSLPL